MADTTSPLLSAESQRHFDIMLGRATETDDPSQVVDDLRVSFLCDGLDAMVKAGSFASSFLVQAQQGGNKATLTDEGFDADMFSLCNTLVQLHEKKVEKLREKERQEEIAAKTKEHGAAMATLSAMADTLLTADILNDDDENGQGASGANANQDEGEMNADGTLKSKTRTAMLPALGEWTTPEQYRQAWRTRVQLILDVPSSSVAGRIYFVFISAVVIMSSLTSVLETLPSVSPVVQRKYFSLWNSLEWFATIVFTLDFLARTFVHTMDSSLPTAKYQNFINFAKSPVNIIDFITLLPQYIQPLFTGRIVTGNLRTLRMLRLYKVVRRFQGFHRLSLALTRSFSALIGPFAFLAACVFFLSAVLFAAERGDFETTQDAFMLPDPGCDNQPVSFLPGPVPPRSPCPHKVMSKFISQWQAFWWCIVTMCTVGYGDFVPVTWVGRLIATVTVIVGMVFIAMPIAVIGTNYTIAVQMTSKSEEADKEDAIQREDQRGKELAGGMAHPGARLLKLLGELLGDPSKDSSLVSSSGGGGGAGPGSGGGGAPGSPGGSGGSASASPGGFGTGGGVGGLSTSVGGTLIGNAGMLDLCAPSLNDLNIIEAVLESVVMAMLEDKNEASLPLWMARWPHAVRETSRKTEVLYRTAVISRPLVVHLGSEGKRLDQHSTTFLSSSNNNNSNSQAGAADKKKGGGANSSSAAALARVGKPSAANSVLNTAVTFPREGSSIPHVCIYHPEVRHSLEMMHEMAKRQDEEQRILEQAGPILADKSNTPGSIALSMDAGGEDGSSRKPLPTVLNHHATMCCMRIWGEPTFLLFASTTSKEATLRSTAANHNIPPLDGTLLHEQVRSSLHDLFRAALVQSPNSLRHLVNSGASATASTSPASAVGSSSGGASTGAGSGGSGGGDGNKQAGADSSGASAGTSLAGLQPEDLTIESLVFRHAVHKRLQWLALELKPVRVRHGDILSFGAAENGHGDVDGSLLEYRFEDNSSNAF